MLHLGKRLGSPVGLKFISDLFIIIMNGFKLMMFNMIYIIQTAFKLWLSKTSPIQPFLIYHYLPFCDHFMTHKLMFHWANWILAALNILQIYYFENKPWSFILEANFHSIYLLKVMLNYISTMCWKVQALYFLVLQSRYPCLVKLIFVNQYKQANPCKWSTGPRKWMQVNLSTLLPKPALSHTTITYNGTIHTT